MIDVSIVIPVFNEQENLNQLMSEIDLQVSNTKKNLEVIFVNDCSTDGSRNLLEIFTKTHNYVKVFDLDSRGGQTGCYQLGFNEAKGKYIIRMDSDLQDNPKDLVQFFSFIDQDYDLVMGLRQQRRHHRLLRLAAHFYDCLVIMVFDSPLHTNSSSYVAFKAKFVQNVHFYKNDHRYLPLIAFQRGANKVGEIIVENRPRIHGASKYKNFEKVLFGIPEILRVIFRLKIGRYKFHQSHLMKLPEGKEANS